MVKRKIVDSSLEDLTNLRSIVGAENVLAHCAGVNYQVYVTESRLLVGKRFALDEKYMNLPTASINTLELITKSLLPPLTFAVLGAIASFVAWWIPTGGQRLALPGFPYDIIVIGSLLVFIASIIVVWWRIGIAVLRIGISGSKKPITVKLVSTAKAEQVFKALKG